MNTENNENQEEKKSSQQMHKVKIRSARRRHPRSCLDCQFRMYHAGCKSAISDAGINFQHSHHSNPICCGQATEGIPWLCKRRAYLFPSRFLLLHPDILQCNHSAYPCTISLVPFYGYRSIHEPIAAEESKALLDAVCMMKPIAWASMFMITDLVAGAVLSPIIAAVMVKKNKQQHTK